jgi:hypothetical protein
MSRAAMKRALDVSCRARGHTVQVQVHDLAERECSFTYHGAWLKDRDRVVLRFPSGIAVTGTIERMRGGVGSMSFEQSLHPAVVAHLGY